MPQHTVRFITRNFGRYDTSSLASYESIGGFSALKKAVCLPREDIVEIISQAHVKGRGGAGYDMGRKWRQAREVPLAIVHANGTTEMCYERRIALAEGDKVIFTHLVD